MSSLDKYINIIDIHIPNWDINFVKNFFNTCTNLSKLQVSELLGTALYHNNYIITATINIYIREHDIKISKMEILKQIYHAKCRDISKRHNDECIQFANFSEINVEPYISEYWYFFQ